MISRMYMQLDIIEIIGVWVGSVGTVAAIWFAFWQLKTERDRQQEIEEKKQANLVAAWEDDVEIHQLDFSTQTQMGLNKTITFHHETPRKYKTGVYIINKSELPIYDVILCVSIQHESPTLEEMLRHIDDIHEPTDLPEYHDYFSCIIPGKHDKTFKDYEPVCSMHSKVHVFIFFTDINGNGWCRDSRGKLHSVNNYKDNVSMPR